MLSWSTGLRAATTLLGVAVATSCGDASAPSINPVDFLLAEADGAWNNPAASALKLAHTPAAPMRVDADQCKYSFSKSAFVCPTREWNFMTFDLSFQLLDAANTSLTAYDASSVASIRTITAVAGTLTINATTTQVIASAGDRTLSGLLANDPTLNGTEYATYTYRAGSFHDTTYAASTITNFKVPSRNGAGFPTGVITTKYHSAPPDTNVSPNGTFTVTFNASQFARLVWALPDVSVMCTFDLKGKTKTTCTP